MYCTGNDDILNYTVVTAERSDRSSLVAFQNYKFNCATENSEQLLSVFVTESVVMAGILNTTIVHSTHSTTVECTLLQPGCTKIFNGLDLIQFSVANGTAGDQLHLPFSSAVHLHHAGRHGHDIGHRIK